MDNTKLRCGNGSRRRDRDRDALVRAVASWTDAADLEHRVERSVVQRRSKRVERRRTPGGCTLQESYDNCTFDGSLGGYFLKYNGRTQ